MAATLVACSRDKSAASQKLTADSSHPAVFQDNSPLAHFDGAGAMQYTKQVVAFGPRPIGSPAHSALENYMRTQLKGTSLEEDAFTAATPVGSKPVRNLIAKFPGTKDGVIVVCGHYDTLYDRPDFVGANDGGSSTGLLLQLAKQLRGQLKNGKLEGYSVWLAFLDGEEAIRQWSSTDSLYGSRHLAEKWQADGTLRQIKGLLLVDMIGDSDLEILRDNSSTPWLEDAVYQAATRFGYQSHFFKMETSMDDDHMPFVQRGVPSVDLIDFNYGYNNAFWHTKDDTLDKLSPESLAITGGVVMQTIQILNQR
jgi:Zn-dependent M28 family amino/carboxypeptidase